jgi:hypothetical protein
MLAHRSNAQWHRPIIRKESPPKSVTTISTEERPTSPSMSCDVSDAEPPLKKRLPVPRPLSKRRNNPSQLISVNSTPSGPGSSFPRRFSDETERETRSPSRDRTSSLLDRVPIPSVISSQLGQMGVRPKPPSSARDQSIAPGTSSAAEEEMSEMTMNYLRR